ncbi:MAG TPA: serine hydrolase [Bryobacteraceae bacterium]
MIGSRRRYLLLLASSIAAAADSSLPEEWRQAARTTDGVVGAAALDLTSGRSASLHGDELFPLASVCKIPIAMNILALVDEGKLALNQQIEVLPRDVWAGVSNIATRWPAQRRFPLGQMIELMVAKSDNTAVETLFRSGGEGPAMATRFRQWNIHGMRVDRSERRCDLDRNGVARIPLPDQWTDGMINALKATTTPPMRYRATLRYLEDPRDTGTPNGTVQLLARLFHGELLSKSSTALLIETLKATTTFPTRLKGLLPPGTIVAHKTGSAGGVNGLSAATNDSAASFCRMGGNLQCRSTSRRARYPMPREIPSLPVSRARHLTTIASLPV